jgi:hypothetical protein
LKHKAPYAKSESWRELEKLGLFENRLVVYHDPCMPTNPTIYLAEPDDEYWGSTSSRQDAIQQ